MNRNVDTEFQIQTFAQKHDELNNSEIAKKGDLSDAVAAMDSKAKDQLIFEFLRLAHRLEDDVGYILGMIDDHLEGTGDAHCGWVISQAAPGGAFNKWCKTFQSVAPVKTSAAMPNAPRGWLIFESWAEAKLALDAFDPELKQYHKIYPVMCIAGMEPRTTEPRQ